MTLTQRVMMWYVMTYLMLKEQLTCLILMYLNLLIHHLTLPRHHESLLIHHPSIMKAYPVTTETIVQAIPQKSLLHALVWFMTMMYLMNP
jgi:hypothetical protein